MNVRQHACLARALQDACGGPDKCLEILEHTPYRMGRTALYACRDANAGRTMPMGAIALLESFQNWRIYSLTIARQVKAPDDAACAVSEACEATEAMTVAQRLVRLAGADRIYTETEKREIEPHLQVVERHIAGVRTAMDAGVAA